MVADRIIGVWGNKHLHDLLVVSFRIARHVRVLQVGVFICRVHQMKVVLSEAHINSGVRCTVNSEVRTSRSDNSVLKGAVGQSVPGNRP
jgi:hypothetical protein